MENIIPPVDYASKRYKGEILSKCHICGYYVPDSFINKDGICIDCENEGLTLDNVNKIKHN
jgi:hypothetical protein